MPYDQETNRMATTCLLSIFAVAVVDADSDFSGLIVLINERENNR